MTNRAFRFGVVAGYARTPDEWVVTARRAESLGYSTFLTPDTVRTLPPLIALTAAATATTSIRIGTYVLASPYRRPKQVAWEVAGLDFLSGGRFELGLGTGRPAARNDTEVLGVPFGTPAERIAQLEEVIKEVRAWQPFGETTSRPPILLAAAGRRMLSLAAEHADAVALAVPPTMSEDALEEPIRVLKEHGRFDELELNSNIAAVGEEVAPWLAQQLGLDVKELIKQGSYAVLRGTPQEMADTLLHRRDRLGISYFSVAGFFMERLAPVVELLAGK